MLRRAALRCARAAVVGVLLTATSTGCTLGRARTFTGRVEDACAKARHSVAALDRHTTGVAAVAYVLDRYTILERLLSETASDTDFPGGDRGRQLRRIWIDPARASLVSGHDAMSALRRTVHDQAAEQATAYAAAAAAGTGGVDAAALSAAGFPQCAAAFTPPPARSGDAHR